MARALLLALTCAATASAAHYMDYSAYGSEYEAPRDPARAAALSDDYRGHSLDYKEETHIKIENPSRDSDDSEVWRKPGIKQRGLIRPIESAFADIANKYERDVEDVHKFRMSHRYPKHRSRLKSDFRDEESPPRRSIKYSRDRNDDVSDIDRKKYFHVDKDDFPDDKSKGFDEEVKFVNEATARRGGRRRPRDRYVDRKNDDLTLEIDDELELVQRMKGDSGGEGLRRTLPPERFQQQLDDDEDELSKKQPLSKVKLKTYEDYDNYYDMRRVYNIQNKLPSFLQRTTERVYPPAPASSMWFHRRITLPEAAQDAKEPEPTRSNVRKPSHPTRPTTKPVVTKITLSTTTINATTFSLAEKSRLSVLEKEQQKKSQPVKPLTKKPPVLMVEPQSSTLSWMRVQELYSDSPERLNKVKKLMRYKLAAEAKSIHNLTNNWDELVCDYIDIDSEASSAVTHLTCAYSHVWIVLHVYLLLVLVVRNVYNLLL